MECVSRQRYPAALCLGLGADGNKTAVFVVCGGPSTIRGRRCPPSCALLHQPDRICDAWTLDHAHMPRDPHHPCNDLTATGPRPALHWRRVTNYILLRLRGTAHGVSVTHQRALATCSRQSPTALRKPQTVYVLSRARQVFTSSSSLQNCCSFLILTGVGHF